MKSMRAHRFNGLVILGALILSGCASASDDAIKVPYSEVANARERFIEMYNQAPNGLSPTDAWANTDPQLRAFLNAYHVVTAVRPKERGELHFVVIDEAGQLLDGVRSEVLGVSHPDLLAMEPTVSQRFITIDKEYRLKWPPSAHSIELKLSKAGYRSIYIQFNPQHSNEIRRYTMAMEMLEEGYVLPPKEPDGPTRIVLPPRMNWEPHVPNESETPEWKDGPGSSFVDREYWPKSIASDARVIVTSDAPRMLTAPLRATYALVDSKGAILRMEHLDPGNAFGFSFGVDPGTQERVLDAWGYGSGEKLPLENGPYEWRLYAVAKPRIPASQPR